VVPRRVLLATAVLLAGLGAACGPPPPPTLHGLDRLDAAAPRGHEFVGAFENRKVEPWAPVVRPSSVALLPDDNLFYSDLGAGTIHVFDRNYLYVGTTDRPGGGFAPLDMATLGFHLYVLDRSNLAVYRFQRNGALRDVILDVSQLDPAQPVRPSALDVDRDGRFALADEAGHRVVVTSPFLDFDYAVGEYGRLVGQMVEPRGVCFGPSGVLYVSDRGNRRVTLFDETGRYLANTPGVDDPHPLLMAPSGLDCDRFGNVYVCDTAGGIVQVLAPDLHPLFRVGEDEFADDNLRRPVDCVVGGDDRLYVVDAGRNALLVYQIVFP
jgi:sugar lactone lactonase YvrE